MDQIELFPFSSPETVLCYIRRLEAMVLKVGPEMTDDQCFRVLGDLSLTTDLLESIMRSIEQTDAWKHRQMLTPPNPIETARANELIAYRHFQRLGRRGRRGASWS